MKSHLLMGWAPSLTQMYRPFWLLYFSSKLSKCQNELLGQPSSMLWWWPAHQHINDAPRSKLLGRPNPSFIIGKWWPPPPAEVIFELTLSNHTLDLLGPLLAGLFNHLVGGCLPNAASCPRWWSPIELTIKLTDKIRWRNDVPIIKTPFGASSFLVNFLFLI